MYTKHMFPYYRAPRKIISDQDPRFTADLAKELCCLLDVKQNISTAYHLQTDGQSERLNQWLEQYVQIYTNYQQTDWTAWLPLAQYVHNSWTSSTTKKMPFDLLMGYMPRLHLSMSQSHMLEAASRHNQLLMACTTALTAIRNTQQMLLKHALRKKGQHHFHPFIVGQKVWLEGTNVTVLWLHRSGRTAWPSSSNTSGSSASQSAREAVALDTLDRRTAQVLVAHWATRQE
jgi:hypothetical protein